MVRPFDLPQKRPVEEQRGEAYPYLVELMRRLLGPDGCPWDREQTFHSLRQYVLEEACEVIDAIESEDRDSLCDELGDLALQVVFLSELASREGAFGPDDVVRGICAKLVRRHPHVFSDGEAHTPEQVTQNWEAIKRRERGERPLLGGIPRALPALERANRLGTKTRSVGFDWPDSRGSRAKVSEELAELDEAIESADSARVQAELGDLLFALVNLARHLGVSPEAALRETSDRYQRRFGFVEERVKERHGDWPRDQRGRPTTGVGLEELDRYWEEAKKAESA